MHFRNYEQETKLHKDDSSLVQRQRNIKGSSYSTNTFFSREIAVHVQLKMCMKTHPSKLETVQISIHGWVDKQSVPLQNTSQQQNKTKQTN